MTKDDYLNQLEKALKNLPPQELEDALAYYTEYFYEWGKERELEAIDALGPPKKVAQTLLAQSNLREMETSPPSLKKSARSVWMVVLAIFAAPIALPLAIGLAAVIFALFIAVAAFFISLFFAGGVIVLTSIVTFVTSFFVLTVHFWTGLFSIGSSLFVLGLGLMLFSGSFKLLRLFTRLIGKMTSKLFTGRDKNEKLS